MSLNEKQVRARTVQLLADTFVNELRDECLGLASELYDRAEVNPPLPGQKLSLNFSITLDGEVFQKCEDIARGKVKQRKKRK